MSRIFQNNLELGWRERWNNTDQELTLSEVLIEVLLKPDNGG